MARGGGGGGRVFCIQLARSVCFCQLVLRKYRLVGQYCSRWALRPFDVELDEEKTRAEVVVLLLVGSVRESMLIFGLLLYYTM